MKLLISFSQRLHWAASIALSIASSLLYSPVSGAVSPTPSIGLNKFELFQQYLGVASGGDGEPRYQRVTQAMGKKAIADAHDIGVSFLRISATRNRASGIDVE